MTRVTHSLCFLFWRKPIDLNRDHKRIAVGLHSYETFVGILTEANETVREIVKIVVFSQLPDFVLIVEVGDKPVLSCLKDVGTDGAYFLGGIDESEIKFGPLLREPVVNLR